MEHLISCLKSQIASNISEDQITKAVGRALHPLNLNQTPSRLTKADQTNNPKDVSAQIHRSDTNSPHRARGAASHIYQDIDELCELPLSDEDDQETAETRSTT